MGSLMGHGGRGFPGALVMGQWDLGGPEGLALVRRELRWDRVRLGDVTATVSRTGSGFVDVQLGGFCGWSWETACG